MFLFDLENSYSFQSIAEQLQAHTRAIPSVPQSSFHIHNVRNYPKNDTLKKASESRKLFLGFATQYPD